MKMSCINPYGPIVIAGFPGVGKSTFAKEIAEDFYPQTIEVFDSDSSKYKENWPEGYIDHILNLIHEGKTSESLVVILVSTHKEVLQRLIDKCIKFTVVYPYSSKKDEFIERYRERGSGEKFCALLDDKWDEFINDIEEIDDALVTKVRVGNDYITDLFNDWVSNISSDPSMILLPFGIKLNSADILYWLYNYLVSKYDFGYSYNQLNKILKMIQTDEFHAEDDDLTYVRVCQLIEENDDSRYLPKFKIYQNH